MSIARLLAAARRIDPATGRPTGLPPQHDRAHGQRRQTQAWERLALADLRAGDPDAAVAAYATQGRVHAAPADQLPDRIVADYRRLPGADQSDGDADAGRVVMLGVRRADVTDLNDTTRQRLLADGRLGHDAVVAGQGDQQREYRAGDRVLVTNYDHRVGLLKDTRATVTAVDPERRILTLTAEDNQPVTVPVDWAARHLDHGYTMTCHKAQGATVEVRPALRGRGADPRSRLRRTLPRASPTTSMSPTTSTATVPPKSKTSGTSTGSPPDSQSAAVRR